MKNYFEIKDGVLVRCSVKKPDVEIPEGVETIAYGAFKVEDSYKGPDNLLRVRIPKSVQNIESGAFQYCENLEEVSILGPAEIGEEAFLSCHNLRKVYLADGVKSVGSKCFAYCSQLKSLYIPSSVTRIGYDIAEMNDASYKMPEFRCQRKGKGKLWHDNWNRVYCDPRFGNDRSHFYFHTTLFGVSRDGTPLEDTQSVRTLVTDMPHGTGVKDQASNSRAESYRIPQATLRLWLTATVINTTTNSEFMLDEEEREMLPHMLREYESSVEHPLDQPWEITLNDECYQLASELDFNVYIDHFEDSFDGTHLIIHHDMPFHNDPYSSYPVSVLTEGATIIAEKIIHNNVNFYDVRLHIQWPEQAYKSYDLEKAFQQIVNDTANRNYTDQDNELEVLLAHKNLKAAVYKCYKPSEFPHQFFEDIRADESWNDLGQIVIQPYEFYQELHSYSDDYKDAAMAYGEDCDDWYSTERRKMDNRLAYEIEY